MSVRSKVRLGVASSAPSQTRRMVLVTDSMSVTTQAPYTVHTSFAKYGDLVARAVMQYGLDRRCDVNGTVWDAALGTWQYTGASPYDLVLHTCGQPQHTSRAWASGPIARSVPYRTVGSAATITGVTNVAAAVVTTSGAHGFIDGQRVVISGVGGATGANNTWGIHVLSSNTFSLTQNGGSGPGVYTSGGTVQGIEYTPGVQFLFVQFGINDAGNGYTAAEYQASLTARLNDWAEVDYKFLLQTWTTNIGPTSTTQGRQDYYDACVAAAAAATPGRFQSSIPFFNMYNATTTVDAPVGGDAISWSGDPHFTGNGHAAFANSIIPGVKAHLGWTL